MTGPAERAVATEYVFDRASEQLLALAYRVLVPEKGAQKRRGNYDHDEVPSDAAEQRPAFGA
ncbi:MAG: hypothetical protein ACP5VR_05905 [Acidimicrobiales bacterium]